MTICRSIRGVADGINSFFLMAESYPIESTSLAAQTVRNLPSLQETWVLSLIWEDALEKEMATHSNILARRIPWTEETGGLQPIGSQRVGHD